MHEFCYGYIKPGYSSKESYCMDTDSFKAQKNRRYLRKHYKRCLNKI